MWIRQAFQVFARSSSAMPQGVLVIVANFGEESREE
jgi:hypothetical protein